MKEKYPYILLVLANIIWGGNFVVGSIAKDYFPPFTFSLIRWLIAFVLLTPFLYKSLIRDHNILLKHKWALLLLSITGVSGYNTLLYLSLHWTTSINAAVINPITPIFIAILSVVILSERVEGAQMIGILFSIIGVLFIMTKGSFGNLASFSFNKGDLLVLLAVFVWALYSICLKKYAGTLPLYSTFYVTTFVGSILLIPFSLFELKFTSQPLIWNISSISILFYVGFFAAIVAFLSWNIGVTKVGAARAGNYLNLLPVFAAILAPILTNESIMWYQIVGGIIVIAGVVISSKIKKSPLSMVNKSTTPQ
ncbi:DMT family transporter [Cytobacillus sp. Hz8]|uniref:DMT family transporter n=1 Tax=Cytobacillus sp. Hz8 TaxID=3347168 RepID=UPI0035E3B4EB